MTTQTESIHIPRSPDQIRAFLAGVHNLPRWTGYRSVGTPDGDRHQAVDAAGTTAATRIESHGDRNHYTISSLVDGQEERAELTVTPTATGAEVSLTVTERPVQGDGSATDKTVSEGIETHPGSMRRQLCRLRAAITELTAVHRPSQTCHAPTKSLPSGDTAY
jgi:hypothetical protein